MKRLIFIKGGNETLEYFSREIGIYAAKLGYDIFWWDMTAPLSSREAFLALDAKSDAVLFTFNFIGLSGESQFAFSEDIDLFSHYGMRKICFLVDHPLYYYTQLEANKPEDIFVLFVDEDHLNYFKRFYPEWNKCGYMPLAGNILHRFCLGEDGGCQKEDEGCRGEDKGCQKEDGISLSEKTLSIPVDEDMLIYDNINSRGLTPDQYSLRPIQVLFAGHLINFKNIEEKIAAADADTREFIYGMLEDMKKDPQLNLNKALADRLSEEFPNESMQVIRKAVHDYGFVDMYIRGYQRQRVLRAVNAAGIPMTIIGRGWERADFINPDLVTMKKGLWTTECLEHMFNSKVTLNVLPNFKSGYHDRIFSGMLAGSLVATDSNAYLDRVLISGTNCIKYGLKSDGELVDFVGQLNNYLENPMEGYEIAVKGRKMAESDHTWKNRAERIFMVTKL